MSNVDRLKNRLADFNALTSAVAIMEWDQQTYMPRGGAAARAEHVGILSRMAHEMFTADETQKLLEHAKGETRDGTDEQALIRVTQRDLDIRTKIPSALVQEKSRLAALAHETWVEARSNNDFKTFAPLLERMFEIVRQEAEHQGY